MAAHDTRTAHTPGCRARSEPRGSSGPARGPVRRRRDLPSPSTVRRRHGKSGRRPRPGSVLRPGSSDLAVQFPGGGVGEQEDAAAALDALAKAMGGGALAIAGYSFGSRIAALIGSRDGRIAGMALIAPPLAMSDFEFLEDPRAPTLMVAGTRDQFCPPDELARFTAARPWITAVTIDGADHFFFGKLFPLGEAVTAWAQQQLPRGRRAP